MSTLDYGDLIAETTRIAAQFCAWAHLPRSRPIIEYAARYIIVKHEGPEGFPSEHHKLLPPEWARLAKLVPRSHPQLVWKAPWKAGQGPWTTQIVNRKRVDYTLEASPGRLTILDEQAGLRREQIVDQRGEDPTEAARAAGQAWADQYAATREWLRAASARAGQVLPNLINWRRLDADSLQTHLGAGTYTLVFSPTITPTASVRWAVTVSRGRKLPEHRASAPDLITAFAQMDAHARMDVNDHKRGEHGELIPLPGDVVFQSGARGFGGSAGTFWGTIAPSGKRVEQLYAMGVFGRAEVKAKTMSTEGWYVQGDPLVTRIREEQEEKQDREEVERTLDYKLDDLDRHVAVTTNAVLYGILKDPEPGDAVLVGRDGYIGLVTEIGESPTVVYVQPESEYNPDRLDETTLGHEPLIRAPRSMLEAAEKLAERYYAEAAEPLDEDHAEDAWQVRRHTEQLRVATEVLQRARAQRANG